MTDKDLVQPEPVRAPVAPFRTFGPVVLVYLLATLLTGAQFWGDSIDYAEGILDHRNFWDFGHLFWRPLGWLLAKALMPLMQVLGAADERTGVLLLLVCV